MSRDESKIVKGVAILCMLFHHLFYQADRYTEFGFSGLIVNADITLMIAKDMKVCVAIFALMSGYGMTMKVRGMEKERRKKTGVRDYIYNMGKSYLGLIKDTGFLMIVTVPVSLIFGLARQPEAIWGGGLSNFARGFISNMLGVSGFFGVEWFIRSWWYLKVAILFLIVFPLLNVASKHKTGQIAIAVAYAVAISCFPGINPSNDNILQSKEHPSFSLYLC